MIKDKYKKILHKEVHPNTYGESKCAEDLSNIVNNYNDKHIAKETGRLLMNFNNRIEDLVHTKRYTETWIKEFYKTYLDYVNSMELPNDIKSRICNLCHTKFNQVLKKVLLEKKPRKNKWGMKNEY
jgi:hypothetical protein